MGLSAGRETVVTSEVADAILTLRIDNPPVNAGSRAVREGLMQALGTLPDDLRGIIITGAGRFFVSGSDLREFSGPLQPPEWPAVFAAIEDCPLPVVAAIPGAALGGGYELALACDWRIAVPGAPVGLPEVGLGIIPGAGGTQRLPRLTGRAEAMRLICTAARVEAGAGLALGMVDRVVPAERLMDEARALILGGAGKRRLMALPVADGGDLDAAAAEALRRAKNRQAGAAAIDMIRKAGLDRPAAVALAEERAVFQELRQSDQAAALRHLFFAERAAAKAVPETATAPKAARVGVVGAGTMGTGIAATLCAAGIEAALYDTDPAAVDRGVATVRGALDGFAGAGKLKGGTEAAMGRLRPAAALQDLAGCDLVIEAVVERLEVKQSVMGALAAVVGPECVLATNTSYLDIDAIAAPVPGPERVLGMHFFAPVPRMRLVEVVPGRATARAALARTMRLAGQTGKLAILAGNAEGFIGNRIYAAYRAQCEFLVEEGAMPWEVDAAIEAMGLAMGPFRVGDLSGLDIGWHMRRSKDATRDPAARYVDLPDRLYDLGRLGRKTGAGWYRYGEDAPRGAPDPVVEALVREAAARRDAGPAPGPEAIRQRALGAIVNEAARLLAEGVAQSAGDIDLVMVNGYGFRPETGGPAFMAARMAPAERAAMLAAVAEATGHGFVAGDVAALVASVG